MEKIPPLLKPGFFLAMILGGLVHSRWVAKALRLPGVLEQPPCGPSEGELAMQWDIWNTPLG